MKEIAKYSFDIHQTPPFMAFRILREIARNAVGEAHVLDLSQGEPGYGFSPSSRSRKLFSFLMLLDSILNDHFSDCPLFAYRSEEDMTEIDAKIKKTAHEYLSESYAKEILKDFEFFITELQKICEAQNLVSTRFRVLYELFKYANLSGGRYPQPFGQDLLQAVMAEEYSKLLGTKVLYSELIAVMGASHAIGSIFKALGSEGIKYLHAGDYVLMTSPVYAPYNLLFEQRGINVVSLAIDPETGNFDPKKIEELKKFRHKIKAIVLIDPNNPTGFGSNLDFLEQITSLAEAHNSLIITDEVYYQFFRGKKSILHIPEAVKRTIRIDSLSKIERGTGLRVGDIYVSAQANKFITENVLRGYIGDYKDIFELLRFAKSPGGKNIGLFQHITGIPGPSVGLALTHLLVGREERERTTDLLLEKMNIFYENLGLEYRGNIYYGMFNLTRIENKFWAQKPVFEKLKAIAQKGVVLMPANLFFAESDRKEHDRTNMVRVSLPNLSRENTKKAAKIIRETLNET